MIHGKKLGRTLDYPTLNIKVPKNLCFSGIFGVMVSGIMNQIKQQNFQELQA